MTIDERKNINTGVIQNLILENRGKLSISGVNDVLSFDDQVVMVETELGLLTVKGENIRINKLSIDTSEVIIEGDISYLAYSDKELEKNKGSLVYTINGILIGILFDIFRVLRKSFKTNDITTYIEDILFWILTGISLLYSIFTFSNGEIRLYMFLGVFLGCLIYMMLISKYFIKINVKIVSIIKRIFGVVFSIISIPLKFLFKPIRFITINIKKFSIKQLKNTKN